MEAACSPKRRYLYELAQHGVIAHVTTCTSDDSETKVTKPKETLLQAFRNECKSSATLRHAYQGSLFLDPYYVINLSLKAI
jgi:hypothetical protein